jgi:hypothetical protein
MESTLVRRAQLMMSNKQPSWRNLCLLEENKLIRSIKALFVINLLFGEFKSDEGYYVFLLKREALFSTLLLLGCHILNFYLFGSGIPSSFNDPAH